jgi:hypothetical protein
MTRSRKKPIAIEAAFSLVLLLVATAACAAPVGTVTELDGNLLVSRANGFVKVLDVGSQIEEGDLLTSRKQTYATLTLTDDSSVTLGPETDLKIERYVYYKRTPDHDGALLALSSGSVRITSGLLGTRSGDTFTLATPTATLDIRGASVVAEYIAPAQAQLSWRENGPPDFHQGSVVPARYSPTADPGFVAMPRYSSALSLAQVPGLPGAPNIGRPPGLYVHVLDGVIQMTNPGGVQSFSAGQFGYTRNLQLPPVLVPTNPGLKFTPPPSFSSPTTALSAPSGLKSQQVDCEVR